VDTVEDMSWGNTIALDILQVAHTKESADESLLFRGIAFPVRDERLVSKAGGGADESTRSRLRAGSVRRKHVSRKYLQRRSSSWRCRERIVPTWSVRMEETTIDLVPVQGR
jgi:hypothetical protein